MAGEQTHKSMEMTSKPRHKSTQIYPVNFNQDTKDIY